MDLGALIAPIGFADNGLEDNWGNWGLTKVVIRGWLLSEREFWRTLEGLILDFFIGSGEDCFGRIGTGCFRSLG